MKDYYAILGIERGASMDEIKAAFKKKAIIYHPDKHQGDLRMEERFKEVNEAYQTLSNPYAKARYDLMVNYGTQEYVHVYASDPYPAAPRRRPVYKRPPINWRENWLATAYAFAFTIVVAAVVMSGIGVKNYLAEMKLAKLLAERRLIFDQARSEYESGQLEAALVHFNNLGIFRPSEEDMELYKSYIYDHLVHEAEAFFTKNDFRNAARFYGLIEQFRTYMPPRLKEHHAYALREIGEPERAILKARELVSDGYNLMDAYLFIAQTFNYDLKDPSKALIYYQAASSNAIEKYKSYYGEAYALVINRKSLPASHYQLYTELANAYLTNGAMDRCIKAASWNIAIWPDSALNFVTRAKAYLGVGQYGEACSDWAQALALGYPNEEGIMMDCVGQ